MKEQLAIARWGILLSLITLLYGYGLGMVFGGAEEPLRAQLSTSGAAWVEAQVQSGKERVAAESASAKVVEKSWVYMKRAHLHANGLGTSALALIILLAYLGVSLKRLRFTSLALGVGALGYSTFWMIAGFMAPGLGSTGAAKEALTFFAGPSAFLCVGGLLSVLAAAITNTRGPR
jgi:hypothetical protein